MEEPTDIIERPNDDLMVLSRVEVQPKRKLNDPSFIGWLLSSGCGILLGWLIYGLVLNPVHPAFMSSMPPVYQLLNIIILSIPITLVVSVMYTFYNNRER